MNLVCDLFSSFGSKSRFFKYMYNSTVRFSGKYEKHRKNCTVKPVDYVISKDQFAEQM